jgi:hypothetical protein
MGQAVKLAEFFKISLDELYPENKVEATPSFD